MPTFTALTTLKGRESAEGLGEAMERLNPEPTGVGVLEVEDGDGKWEVGGYFIEAPDQAELALLSTVFGAATFVVSELPDEDWVAKVRRDLAPVEAGRFFVYGSHDADALPQNKVGLLVEAAMAFGTGHHGTTKGCLTALETLIEQGFKPCSVADIGCGTAVLAMAAAKVWECPILASDIDEIAVETASANAVENGLSGRINCIEAAGFDHAEISQAAPFELVFANILKGPLINLAGDMANSTLNDGYIILSGLLTSQSQEVVAAYVKTGFQLVDESAIGEWVTLSMKKRTI